MKPATLVLLLLCVLNALTLYKLAVIDRQLAQLEYQPALAESTVAARTGPELLSTESLIADVRSVVRDELRRAAMDDGTIAVARPAASIDLPPTTHEYAEQIEQLQQRITYFESVGEISTSEMEALQVDIARLHATDRRRFLNELTQAMNAGRIKGLF